MIEVLKTLLPPPTHPIETPKTPWPEIDHIPFPTFYQEIIKTYGSGEIGGFITLFNPFSKNKNLNFFKQCAGILEDLQELKQSAPEYYAFTFYPAQGGLIPFGVTANGDYLFWLYDKECASDAWKIGILASRDAVIEEIGMHFEAFLLSLLRGEIVCASFPNAPFSTPLTFTPFR